jgi:hypothetical protein
MSHTIPSRRSDSGARPIRGRLVPPWIALVAVMCVALFEAVRWWQRPAPRSFPADGPVTILGTNLTGSGYVGSRACSECHPGEYASHSRTGHAQTLQRAGISHIARRLHGREADDPEIRGVRWRFRFENGKLIALRQEAQQDKGFVLDYALGSGQHAVTFVTLRASDIGPPTGLEHRLSYFTSDDKLDLTPGHSMKSGKPGLMSFGFVLLPAVLRDCLECHGTPTAPPWKGGLAPETLLPNVTCERCHGPGRAHIEAARKGSIDRTAISMPFGPGGWTAESQLALCGGCHRRTEMVPAEKIRRDNPALARFPSVGLVQSECYRRSAGALTCTTCHDPHSRAARDRTTYDSACRSCHSVSSEVPRGMVTANAARACPIEPQGRCVACHMPRRDAGQGLLFSDHWIRSPSGASSSWPAPSTPP